MPKIETTKARIEEFQNLVKYTPIGFGGALAVLFSSVIKIYTEKGSFNVALTVLISITFILLSVGFFASATIYTLVILAKLDNIRDEEDGRLFKNGPEDVAGVFATATIVMFLSAALAVILVGVTLAYLISH